MRKRVVVAFAACAFMLAMLPGVASALIVDGRPGQFELESIEILDGADLCVARYPDPSADNVLISNGFGGAAADIRVVENKNRVKVICRFLDTSGIYEANAEVGYTDDCTYRSAGVTLTNGTGRVTAAANNAKDGSNGGNVTVQCTFEVDG